jgi:hypothetical protein
MLRFGGGRLFHLCFVQLPVELRLLCYRIQLQHRFYHETDDMRGAPLASCIGRICVLSTLHIFKLVAFERTDAY